MQIRIGDVEFSNGALGWILGPCALESRDLALRVAAHLRTLPESDNIVFKGSFDKANRTSLSSPRGPGIDEGLRILEDVKQETNLPVITDIHERAQAMVVAPVVDAIQIPAFLSRQTDLLLAAVETTLPIFVKKGQFMAASDMEHVVTKAGDSPLLLGERGTTFGYGDLIVDMRSLVDMRAWAPVIFDGTHAVQQPGSNQGSSGGKRQYIAPLCRAARAVGVDGFFLETHPEPEKAISDRETQIPLAELSSLMQDITATNALS